MKLFLIRSGIVFVSLALMACINERSTRDVSQPSPSQATPSVTPIRRFSPVASPSINDSSVSPRPSVSVAPMMDASGLSLIIPVASVRREQLHDTFNEARSEGRVHEAIDILAPQGTNVMAAADGTIVKLFTSDKGGITIYQLSSDQQFVFYYAHLDRYAESLAEKQQVRQGDVIGYVGDTGNAQPGNYHLHFAIWQITDPKNFWSGMNLNPYDMLRHASTSR